MHLVIDGGPHGYQNGGHAHADALSLTLSVRRHAAADRSGHRLLHDGYRLRDRMRSTPLHNTLTLDGRSQSVPSGPVSLGARRQRGVTPLADGAPLRLLRRLARRVCAGRAPPARARRCTATCVVVADLIARDRRAHRSRRALASRSRWTVDDPRRRRRVHAARSRRDRVGFTVPQGTSTLSPATTATGLGLGARLRPLLVRTTTLRVAHEQRAVLDGERVRSGSDNPVADVDWVPIWAEARRDRSRGGDRTAPTPRRTWPSMRSVARAGAWRSSRPGFRRRCRRMPLGDDGDAPGALADGAASRGCGDRSHARTCAAA